MALCNQTGCNNPIPLAETGGVCRCCNPPDTGEDTGIHEDVQLNKLMSVDMWVAFNTGKVRKAMKAARKRMEVRNA